MEAIKSSKPCKRRKEHYSKPLHRKQKGLAGHLDKKLREQLGSRSISLRKGDSVKLLRGARRGTSGKITVVDYNRGVVFIDKLARKKASGEEIPLPVRASKLLVVDVDKSDAKRFKGKKLAREATKNVAGREKTGKMKAVDEKGGKV